MPSRSLAWLVAGFVALSIMCVAWVYGAGRVPASMNEFFSQSRQRHEAPDRFQERLQAELRRAAARRGPASFRVAEDDDEARTDPAARAQAIFAGLDEYFKRLLTVREAQRRSLADRARVVMSAPMVFVLSPPFTHSHVVPNVPAGDHTWLSEGGAKGLAGEEGGHLWAGINTIDLDPDDMNGADFRDAWAFVGVAWVAPVDGTVTAKAWLKSFDYSVDIDALPVPPSGNYYFNIAPSMMWFRINLLGGTVLFPPDWVGMPESPDNVWQPEVQHWSQPEEAEPFDVTTFHESYQTPGFVPIWLADSGDNFQVQKDCHYWFYVGLRASTFVSEAAPAGQHTVNCTILGMGSAWIDRIEVTVQPGE